MCVYCFIYLLDWNRLYLFKNKRTRLYILLKIRLTLRCLSIVTSWMCNLRYCDVFVLVMVTMYNVFSRYYFADIKYDLQDELAELFPRVSLNVNTVHCSPLHKETKIWSDHVDISTVQEEGWICSICIDRRLCQWKVRLIIFSVSPTPSIEYIISMHFRLSYST